MAAEAEAAREAKAKIIAAEGEMNASKNLKEAADTIASSGAALQLRLVLVAFEVTFRGIDLFRKIGYIREIDRFRTIK